MSAPPPERPSVITSDMIADQRVEFERGMSFAPRLTLIIIAINLAVFAWELAVGALDSADAIVAAGALQRSEVLRGEVWRLATAPFLHGGFDHIVGNCVVLYIVGMGCEHAIGPRQTLWVYSTAGFAGSLLSAVVNPGPSVGASGAIFGVMAALVYVLHAHRDRIVVRDNRIGFVLGVWTIYQIASGFLTPYVDNMAHAGGVLGGLLAAHFAGPIIFDQVPAPPGPPLP